MNHKYRTRIQGESLQEKIRDYEFKLVEYMLLPAFYAALTLFVWYIYLAAVKIDFFLRDYILNNYTSVCNSRIC